MRTAPASYLVNKTHLKQKALTLRIPQHVHEGLNAARERADRAGFVFDIQAVVVEALEWAVAKVTGELTGVEQGEPLEVKAATPRRKRQVAKGAEGLK
jgi:outer membrane receptor for monomeric catechols